MWNQKRLFFEGKSRWALQEVYSNGLTELKKKIILFIALLLFRGSHLIKVTPMSFSSILKKEGMKERREGGRKTGREWGKGGRAGVEKGGRKEEGETREGGRRERTRGASSLKSAKQKSKSLVINYIDIKYTLKESMLKWKEREIRKKVWTCATEIYDISSQ